jgi:7-carboxy-7-deazaguanine synthase
MFLTLQGEGVHAGSRAVFIRTAGCNVWSGNPQDRERDTKRGCCAAWCDTEFRGTGGTNGGKLLAVEIAARVRDLWQSDEDPLVVITGGEPSLVIDDALLFALHLERARVHVETNGSHLLPKTVDWITLSPKPPMRVVDQRYDEVKVIYPAVDPTHYVNHAANRFIQPLDQGDNYANMDVCLSFVMAHPEWRLSVQTHKVLGIP